MKTYRLGMVLFAVVLLLGVIASDAYAGQPALLDQTRHGTIVGNWGGAYDFYLFDHPGGGRPVTLRMNFGPWHPNKERGIGFKLYTENGRLAAESLKVKSHPTQLALTLTNDFPTRYLVQVHNYYHGFTIQYDLTPEGLTEARAAVGPVVTGGTAEQPAILVQLGQGTVPGLRHGSFDDFLFQHPGGKPLWIKMAYQPDHWIIAHGVGFNVYHGKTLVAQGQPLKDKLHVRWVKLEPATPTTYFIQVYNYIPEVILSYQIAVTDQPVE